MTHPGELNNDLDWIAFCYWKNELADEQRDWFETELEDNQAAREALARAVETTEAIGAVQWLDAPRKRQAAVSAAMWWMTVGAAICLCVVFIAKSIRSGSAVPLASNDLHSSQVSLAIAWDEMRLRFQAEIEPVWGEMEMGDDAPQIETHLADNNQPEEEPPMPPSWMESALLGMADEDQDDQEWEGQP